MNVPNNELYFTREEVLQVLDDFLRAYKEGKYHYKDKVDYRVWREIKNCQYGIKVKEYDNILEFHPKASNYQTKMYQTYKFNKYEGFGEFFYLKYFTMHSEYIPSNIIKEGDNEMALSNTTGYTQVYNDSSFGNFTSTSDWAGKISVDTSATSVRAVGLNELISDIVDEKLNENNKKGDKDMMRGFNFNFGPCTADNVRMSVYGLAIKNQNDEWVSYNPSTKQIVNVDLLKFDGRKFMYKMPVAIKDIAAGDIVIHNKVPMFVIDVENGNITAVDVRAGEEKKILPTNSPFGFNFVTKVVSMFSAFEGSPTPDSPFGNFLPFMLMDEDGEDIDPFVMCMMMQNQGNGTNIFNNPMMLYFLFNNKNADTNNLFPLFFMQGMNQQSATITEPAK